MTTIVPLHKHLGNGPGGEETGSIPPVSDSFELSSGLVEDFDGTITDAFYTYDAAYNNGDSCVLKLVVTPDEDGLFDDGETTLMYPAGERFEPADNGKEVIHESGKRKNFNKNSGVGLLIGSVAELDGGIDLLKSRGEAWEAGIWTGLHVSFFGKEFSWTDRKARDENGNPVVHTYNRTLIREILEDGAGTPEKKAPAKRTATKKAAQKAPEPEPEADDAEDVLGHLDAKLRGKLKAIATSSDSHDAFIEQVYTDLADELNDDLEALVVDADFYELLTKG